MSLNDQKRTLALDLYDIGALKFGEFTFKSGLISPMYIDLRLFISYPKVLKKVTRLYVDILKGLKYDRLAGVAYGALPITSAISLELDCPWIFLRKEALEKKYGIEKSLEGEYSPGDKIVMIEDLVTRATSLLEAISAIERHGLAVKDTVVLLNYEKGGEENLQKKGYTLHAFMTVRELIEIMKTEGKLTPEKYKQCLAFLQS
jgi:uridine monophosphate synthetase